MSGERETFVVQSSVDPVAEGLWAPAPVLIENEDVGIEPYWLGTGVSLALQAKAREGDRPVPADVAKAIEGVQIPVLRMGEAIEFILLMRQMTPETIEERSPSRVYFTKEFSAQLTGYARGPFAGGGDGDLLVYGPQAAMGQDGSPQGLLFWLGDD